MHCNIGPIGAKEHTVELSVLNVVRSLHLLSIAFDEVLDECIDYLSLTSPGAHLLESTKTLLSVSFN